MGHQKRAFLACLFLATDGMPNEASKTKKPFLTCLFVL